MVRRVGVVLVLLFALRARAIRRMPSPFGLGILLTAFASR